ncbi:uncharacterized protein WCC33_009917 [Rhinophrynus dorsalis]
MEAAEVNVAEATRVKEEHSQVVIQEHKNKALSQFIEDPDRKEPLIGLKYAVEFKQVGSKPILYKCNLCRVTGDLINIISHLIGIPHIKTVMGKDYKDLFANLKRSYLLKADLNKNLKLTAKDLERKEGIKEIKVENMNDQLKGNLVEKASSVKGLNQGAVALWLEDQEKKIVSFPDRRQAAVLYSKDLVISSKEEASQVLKLTEHLNNLLENYHMQSQSDETKKSCSRDDEFRLKEHAHDKSSRSSGQTNSDKYSGTSELPTRKRKISWDNEELLQSISAYSYAINTECFQYSSTGDSSSQLAYLTGLCYNPYTSQSISADNAYAQNGQYYAYLQDTGNSQFYSMGRNPNVEVNPAEETVYSDYYSTSGCADTEISHAEEQSETLFVSDTQEPPDSDVMRSSCEEDPSPPLTSSSHDRPSETETTTCPRDKTSKTLTPDILVLLKGKDVNTVTNILKTLSPFYPALQEVNIEMLAQVLSQTGALD